MLTQTSHTVDALQCVALSAPPAGGFDATVVVVTKNRRDSVVRAVRSALEQEGSIEVLVICDGCTDRTASRLQTEFGDRLSLYSASRSRGYIVRRNEAAGLARAPILVSLDDDSVFIDRSTVARVLPLFDDACIGAVAMPFINLSNSGKVLQRGAADALFATDRYTGTAHAIRRSDFELVGGYREAFVHEGEETDLCLRLLGARRLTVLATTPPIHHFQIDAQDIGRRMYFGRRNDVLFATWNVPWPYVIPHLTYTTLNGLALGFQHRVQRRTLAGLVSGYRQAVRIRGVRRPVDLQTYRLHRRLRKRGPMLVGEALSALAHASRPAMHPGADRST